MKKKILILVYHFPPYFSGGAVLRTVKFVKYFKETDWKPIIITSRHKMPDFIDSNLLKDIEGVKIYEIKDYIWSILKYFSYKKQEKKKIITEKLSVKILNQFYLLFNRIILEMLRIIFNNPFIPSKNFWWVLVSFLIAKKFIKKEKIDFIYTTFPHEPAHLVGLLLKFTTNKKWIADFRDRWVGNPLFKRGLIRQKFDFYLEKKVINKADFVITATSGITEWYKKKYNINNICTLWNGYDEDDFKNIKVDKTNSDKFIISYVGGIGGHRSIDCVLEAFEKIESNILNKIIFRIIGYADNNFFRKIEKSKFRKNIEFIPFVEHAKAIEFMLSSNALLVIVYKSEDGQNVATGKVFEYIRSGKPILAICPKNGVLWNIIKKNNLGICVEYDDVEGIANSIEKLFKGEVNYNFNPELVNQFDRKVSFNKLLNILNSL